MNEKQYNELLNELKSINANLTYLRTEQENSWDYMRDMRKHLKEIQFNTSFIAIVIFLVIAVKIIMLFLGYNTLQSMM